MNGGIWNDGFYCCVGQNSSDFMWAWDARRRYEISNDNVLECRRSKDETIKIVTILFGTGYYWPLSGRFAVYGPGDGCSWTNQPMLKIYGPHGQVDRVECDCSRASNSNIGTPSSKSGYRIHSFVDYLSNYRYKFKFLNRSLAVKAEQKRTYIFFHFCNNSSS